MAAVSVQRPVSAPQTSEPSLTAKELLLVGGDFVNTGLGAHRVAQVITTSAKWVEQADPNFFGPTAKSIIGGVRVGDNVGMIPKIINQTARVVKGYEAYDMVKKAPSAKEESITSKFYGLLLEINEWIGDFAKVFMLGAPNSATAQVVSNATDLVLDVRDFRESSSGVTKSETDLAKLQEASAPEREQRMQVEEKRGHMLKIVKSICSFAGNFLALLGVILGVAVVPAIIVLTISTAHIVFALWNKFYTDTMTHKLEARLRDRQIAAMSV